jgi:hypothetical protein
MQQLSPEMKSCLDACQHCHAVCLQTAMQHCLEVGGKHVEPEHFRLMMACAQICQTSVELMLIGWEHHGAQCGICAQACEDCARDCDRLGGMEECAAACRACAKECRAMAIRAMAA